MLGKDLGSGLCWGAPAQTVVGRAFFLESLQVHMMRRCGWAEHPEQVNVAISFFQGAFWVLVHAVELSMAAEWAVLKKSTANTSCTAALLMSACSGCS